MTRALRPIFDHVMVVRDIDIVEIDRAAFSHRGDQEIGEPFPARTARISGAALRLEQVPFERLFGADHEIAIDLVKTPRDLWLSRSGTAALVRICDNCSPGH